MKEWDSFGQIKSAKGVWLIDSKGKKMIDAVASMWCNVWGHSNPELIKTITNQSKKLQHSSMFNLTKNNFGAFFLIEILVLNCLKVFKCYKIN